VRPTFHEPALFAKQAANIDRISNGRLSLNVVSAWWADEAKQYGVAFDEHDDRYRRTAEWLDVVNGLWSEERFTFDGRFYRTRDAIVEPKPLAFPRPTIYAGGESDAAKTMIAERCDAYVMHGDPPERIATKIADLRARRQRAGRPPLAFGMAAYAIVRDTMEDAERERARITNVQELSAVAREHEARAAGVARGLLRVESRTARRARRYAGSRARTDRALRSRRRRSAPASVQSAARGDGTIRGHRDRHGPGATARVAVPAGVTARACFTGDGGQQRERPGMRASHRAPERHAGHGEKEHP